MKRLLLTVSAFALFLPCAFSEEQPKQEGLVKKQFTRVVASGAKQRIGFFHAVHPDCTASGDVTLRVTKQPEHGTVETAAMTNYPTYPKENIALSAMSTRLRVCRLITNRQRNTPATMNLTFSFFSLAEWVGKFITT
jgi:hypothetical protein